MLSFYGMLGDVNHVSSSLWNPGGFFLVIIFVLRFWGIFILQLILHGNFFWGEGL